MSKNLTTQKKKKSDKSVLAPGGAYAYAYAKHRTTTRKKEFPQPNFVRIGFFKRP